MTEQQHDATSETIAAIKAAPKEDRGITKDQVDLRVAEIKLEEQEAEFRRKHPEVMPPEKPAYKPVDNDNRWTRMCSHPGCFAVFAGPPPVQAPVVFCQTHSF